MMASISEIVSTFLFTIVSLTVISSTHGITISDTPADAAGLYGTSLEVNCTLNLTARQILSWQLTPHGSSSSSAIYTATADSATVVDPNSFDVDSMNNLLIRSLTWSSAGSYECSIIDPDDPSSNQDHSAEIVTVDALSCANDNVIYQEGDLIEMNCTTSYAGALVPHLELTVHGDVEMDVDTGNSDSTVFLSHVLNATDALDGTLCECHLDFRTSSTEEQSPPSYKDSCMFTLNVTYGIRDLQVLPQAEDDGTIEVYVGDYVNCTARGNPDPRIWWKKLSGGSSISDVEGAHLLVTSSMLGTNVYNCTAENEVNGTTFSESIEVTFKAAEQPPNAASVTSVAILLHASALLVGAWLV